MAQSIILKRSSLQGKVPTTSSLSVGEIAINTYDGKIYLNRSGSSQSIQEIVTTNVINTGSITLTKTGSFGELVVSQDGNFLRDLYVTRDIIGNGSIDILGAVSASIVSASLFIGNGAGLINITASMRPDDFDFNSEPFAGTIGYIQGSGSLYKVATTNTGVEFRYNDVTRGTFDITNGFSGSIFGIGDVVAFSSSVASLNAFSSSTAGLNSLNQFTSSINAWSRSLATTGSNSFKADQQITGSLGVSGDITVLGSVNARQFNIGIISSSILYTSGSTKFGDTQDDTMSITGSLIVSGSQGITGSLNVRIGTGETRFGGVNGRTLAAYDNNTLANFDFEAVQTYFNSDFLINDTKKISTQNGSTGDLYLTTAGASNAVRIDRNVKITGSLNISGSQIVTGSITATSFNGTINSTNGVVSGSAQVVGILSSLNTYTGSNDTTNTTQNNRLTNLETTSASLNISVTNINSFSASQITKDSTLATYTGSIDTKFTTLATLTGSNSIRLTNLETTSASVNISVTNLNSYSASVSNSIQQLNLFTSSTAALGSLNSFTSSAAPRLTNLETTSASVNGHIADINSKTGSYARTNSTNTFNGTQIVSGSLFVTQDLVVLGSSSIQNISSSNLVIGAAYITLNTFTPASRFAGINIIDSGSAGSSGSFLYDAVQDEFIQVHKGNGTNVTSSHFIQGPQTYDNLGNEIYLTNNRLTKGTGLEHIVDSNITDTGTEISLNSLTSVTGSFIVSGNITGTIRATNGVVSGSSQVSLAGTSDYNGLFGGIASATSSLNTFSASVNGHITDINTKTGSFETKFTTLASVSASLNQFTASINGWSGSIATTGSNTFRGNQTITGSLRVSGSTGITGSISVNGGAGFQASNVDISGGLAVKGEVNIANGAYVDPYAGVAYDLKMGGAGNAIATRGRVSFDNGKVQTDGSGNLIVTGSLRVSGSTVFTGSVTAANGFTGSLFGTASFALNGSSNAIMYQTASAASTWVFNHFLATPYPVVTVYDNNNSVIIPQSIVSNDSSSLTITFSSARTGVAVASKGGYVGSAVGTATVANALTTARLINGTSFDGTQNITIPNLVSGSTQISLAGTSDYSSLFGGIASATASLNTFSASANSSILQLNVFSASANINTGSLATTGSNIFRGNQTITGSLNASGSFVLNGVISGSSDMVLSGVGSTTAAPRLIGITPYVAGNAAQFIFGDTGNAIQNAFGGMMQIVSFHAMQIYGGRAGTGVSFNTGVTANDPSLNVIGTGTTRPTLVATAAGSQTANIQEWRNSGNTPLASISSAGLIVGSIGATNGVVSGSSQVIGILSSLNTYTGSNDTTNTTQNSRLTNLETTSASVNISVSNLNTYSASVSNSIQQLSLKTGSYATTGSNSFIGNQTISGSLTIGSASVSTENTLIVGAPPAGGTGEGGQILLAASGGVYASASMIDNWQNNFRILRGTNAGSDALVAQWNMHTKQMQLPAYNSVSAFAGTATANLAVDSGGNIITVSTSGASVFPYTGNAVITGSLTTTGIIYATPNGGMYFQGGDDAALYDINISNHMGIYGVQDATVASIKLGSGGGIISGKNGSIGIGTINPSSGSLHVTGSIFAASITGAIAATNGVVSGSSQITYSAISSIPAGIISGSSQLSGTTIANLTITNLTTVNQTSSVVFSSGSNTFGDAGNDIHSFTGSVNITGSLNVIASVMNLTTGSITANYMHLAKYITVAGDLDFNI